MTTELLIKLTMVATFVLGFVLPFGYFYTGKKTKNRYKKSLTTNLVFVVAGILIAIVLAYNPEVALASTGAAAENPAQHRRPGSSAVSGSGPVEHRTALPRTLDARTYQPAASAAQPAAAGRAGAAPVADRP